MIAIITVLLVVFAIKLVWNAGVGVYIVRTGIRTRAGKPGRVSLMPYFEAAVLTLASVLVWTNGGYLGRNAWFVLLVGLLAGIGSYGAMVLGAIITGMVLNRRRRY